MDTLVPSAAIAAYAEPLLDGRRVIVFGDAASSLAEQLVERGARVVQVYDEDPARAAEAAARNRSRNVSIAPLGEGDLTVRDGAFDVAIVEDITTTKTAADLLKLVRRALSQRGVAVIASPNPEARTQLLGRRPPRDTIGYYDLYDLVSSEFEHVRMLGQAPFAGYAIVDFAHEGDLELSIDTGFVPNGAEEPEWFLALASERTVELDAFAVIQLPFSELSPQGEARTDGDLSALREQHRAALDRIERLQAEQVAAREDLAQAHRTEKTRFETDLAGVRKQLQEKDAWIAELEARAAAADARADEALDQVEQERKKEAGRFATLQAEVSALKQDNANFAERLRAREEELQKALAVEDVSATDEYTKLEAELKARGNDVRRLEKDLREAVRTGRELAEELARSQVARPQMEPETAEDISALTAMNARLAADLAAARWTIQELEDRLESARSGQADLHGTRAHE